MMAEFINTYPLVWDENDPLKKSGFLNTTGSGENDFESMGRVPASGGLPFKEKYSCPAVPYTGETELTYFSTEVEMFIKSLRQSFRFPVPYTIQNLQQKQPEYFVYRETERDETLVIQTGVVVRPAIVYLNKRSCYVSSEPYRGISIDFEKRRVLYELSFLYEDADISPSVCRRGLPVAEKYKAIRIEDSSFVLMEMQLRKVMDKKWIEDWKDFILKRFREAYVLVKRSINVSRNGSRAQKATRTLSDLDFFYSVAPEFVLAKQRPSELWEDVQHLIRYDISLFLAGPVFIRDASSSVMRILKAIGSRELWRRFRTQPEVLIDLYNALDRESMAETGEDDLCADKPSMGQTTEVMMRYKDQFLGLISAICADHILDTGGQKMSGVEFKKYDDWFIDGNILFGDKKGRIRLRQAETRSVERTNAKTGHNYTVRKTFYDPFIELHPLEMIRLRMKCPEGKEKTVRVPAIFVKNIADQGEWADVNEHIRTGISILVLIIAVVFPPEALLLALLDIALASADVFLQVSGTRRKLENGPDGEYWKQVFARWDGIALLTSLGLASAVGFINFAGRRGIKEATGRLMIAEVVKKSGIIRIAEGNTLEVVSRSLGSIPNSGTDKVITRLAEEYNVLIFKETLKSGGERMHVIRFLENAEDPVEILSGVSRQELDSFLSKIRRLKNSEYIISYLDEFGGIVNPYTKKYSVRKLQALINTAAAYKDYGNTGMRLIQNVNEKVANIISTLPTRKIDELVMVSGMAYRKGNDIVVAIETNFLKKEINGSEKAVFESFIENMHITLKNRYAKHIEILKTNGILAEEVDILRAGIAGTHGEIRALDKLLKEIDPQGVLGDGIFNKIVGYNRYLREGANVIQPPCVHCYYLSFGVKIIGF